MIPFVECHLVEFDVGGKKQYEIGIKDKWGGTVYIEIKEVRNWLGRTEGLEIKDIFKSDNIRKYHHVGNTKVLLDDVS